MIMSEGYTSNTESTAALQNSTDNTVASQN